MLFVHFRYYDTDSSSFIERDIRPISNKKTCCFGVNNWLIDIRALILNGLELTHGSVWMAYPSENFSKILYEMIIYFASLTYV